MGSGPQATPIHVVAAIFGVGTILDIKFSVILRLNIEKRTTYSQVLRGDFIILTFIN